MANHEAPAPVARPLGELLAAQRTAFRTRAPGYAERVDALRSMERTLLRRRHDIAEAISTDFGGRARQETFALELFPLVNEIRHACRHLRRWMESEPAPIQWQFWPAKARILHQPLGIVGILSTWNYPLFLSLGPLVGALAAGNHAILKPSELAPVTADLLASIVEELYPPSYVAVVTGGPDAAAALTALPLDHLLFTGSTRVGRLVMKAASENLVPVTLELGGKSPAIVHPAYDVERAATRIMTGKLYTAGQTCVAPDYALVPGQRRDAFVSAARAAATRMYPTLVRNPDYARIINGHHYRRLRGLVDDARAGGATVIELNPAAEECHEGNRVFPPTLVIGAREAMPLLGEEIFGPILPVVEYETLDQAIAYVNARPRPLALYYFDDNERRADDVVAGMTAGGVTVNDCIFHVGQPSLPFGGVGASGMGRYHGFDGFQTFSHRKAVFIQRRWTSFGLLRPPYGEAARRVLRLLLGRG
jgi:coniferyl-aldehyde dehydrogenase